MFSFKSSVFFSLLCLISTTYSYDQLESIANSILGDVMSRMGGPEAALTHPGLDSFDDYPNIPPNSGPSEVSGSKDYPERSFEARRDAILGRESIRDQEFLEENSLYGKLSMQGGAGEGFQRLKPDGSVKNLKVVKTDALLPAYCEPPNPCPLGYVADDGCLEEFENTAAFSREYQQHQNCMCDSEHMFDCPGATRENEIDALARSFENEGLAESTLDRFFQDLQIRDGHKIVAKKFFAHKPINPYLEGEKLPVIAKKAPKSSIK
ncbi:neuroendocrine protein 7B2 [Trichonephila clavata]|uniref:Neuroendocrine protein 7B2 n=1 Tax=Trichonephila clavata TaxID=2740835 RepID=A0A8X6G4P6_TRICU|nr:neuroendocrine protein 7B2 [Trichonephila clavata]